ncbi:unnamed protein product [Paramecium pentaurelia]|uniref:Radial spoke head protein 9 homolog n=1 Tax=Paramecium pentaurelia TaxID=43138 RepID=A0A8S1YKZ2_9CILI|nr:unnamed protein product [Paramecium pentaurelia]
MDISFNDLKFIQQIGQTLNLEERIKLKLAILKIQEHYTFDEVLFWGRVEGVEKDYYIAIGIQYKGQYEFPLKKFYWSSNNYHFAELPKYNEEYALRAENLREPFTGQHEHIVFKTEEEINFEDSLEIPAQLPAKHFSELERLSFVVQQIEFQCASIPVGSYRLTPTHELIRKTFKGVKAELKNYQHFRAPIRKDKQDLIARDEALYKEDFLDSLVEDSPNQQWSLQTDSTQRNITLRNLIWPGYVTYNNDYTFGYAYFGDGIKNSDFEFLL